MSESLFEQYKAALRRGHMAALAGELDDALAAYDAAARLVPDRALPLASRATVLHRLDRWPEAADAFDRALELAPDDEATLRARATAREERDLRSGAAADFERLAFVLDVAGRAAPAAEAARRAQQLEPSREREALAGRLNAAAELSAPVDSRGSAPADPGPVRGWGNTDDGRVVTDPWAAALDERRLEAFEDRTPEEAGHGEAPAADDVPAADDLPTAERRRLSTQDSVAYDMLDSLRAGMDSDEASAGDDPEPVATRTTADEAALPDGHADDVAQVEGENVDVAQTDGDAAAAEGGDAAEGGSWPPIDLPSPPPPPMVGPPPDPEELLAEAALVLEAQEVDAARDLMLTAASVHRAAGRIDAALDVCLNLLAIAPGDPRVHLAIANLQLDRGWNAVATEKIDLLVRLTSLTGDTQAEADVHGLASERLRDDPAASTAAR